MKISYLQASRKLIFLFINEPYILDHISLFGKVGPSEKYWTIIAERRRKVLAAVIKEHQRLNTVIIALEEENMCCKQLLENTTVLVRALKVRFFNHNKLYFLFLLYTA